jgi:hypothetical protein
MKRINISGVIANQLEHDPNELDKVAGTWGKYPFDVFWVQTSWPQSDPLDRLTNTLEQYMR